MPGLRTGIALSLALLWSTAAPAAQVRGTVEWEGAARGPVSVALFPLDGQTLPTLAVRERLIHVRQRQFEPPYLVARVGDRLRLSNQDRVHHLITAPYAPQPLQAALSAAGSADAQTSLTFTTPGTWYLFCRIHPHSYARIDVLATPLATMVSDDGGFSFDDVPPGRWRLRVAARGAEPVTRELVAFTAPPPITIKLSARGDAAAVGEGPSVTSLFPLQGRAQ